jgi:hypothetical protein
LQLKVGLNLPVLLQKEKEKNDRGTTIQVNQLRAFGAGQLTLRFAPFQLPVIEALCV